MQLSEYGVRIKKVSAIKVSVNEERFMIQDLNLFYSHLLYLEVRWISPVSGTV